MESYALLLAATLNAGTVLALAALGLLINEKAGVVNLGAEGLMLCAAIAGFAAVVHTGNDWLGFAAGMGAGGAVQRPQMLHRELLGHVFRNCQGVPHHHVIVHQQGHLDLRRSHAAVTALQDEMAPVGRVVEGDVGERDKRHIAQSPQCRCPHDGTEPTLVDHLIA